MFKPMRAASEVVTIEEFPSLKFPLLRSNKIDGIGCVIIDGVAYSRKLKPIPNQYIQSMLKHLPSGFHGELAPRNPTGDKTWNEAQSGVMSREGKPSFTFWVFDWFTGKDVDYQTRFASLRHWMMKNGTDFYKYVPHELVRDAGTLRTYHLYALRQGYEGSMLRAVDGRYKHGRATRKEAILLKVKPKPDIEAIVVGFKEEMQNNNEATVAEDGRSKRSKRKENLVAKGTLGALIAEIETPSNGIIQIDVGSGLDDDERARIWKNRKKYMGRVFTVEFLNWTVNNKLRSPVFKGWRND